MHSAFRCMDVIGKGNDSFVITVCPLHGNLSDTGIRFPGHVNGIRMQCIMIAVEEFHEFPNAALVTHFISCFLAGTQIFRNDMKSAVQERLFSHTDMQRFIIINRIIKHLGIRFEANYRSSMIRCSNLCHVLGDVSSRKLHLVHNTVTMNGHFQPFGQGIDNRSAYAVQTAGHFISAAAEFATGMKDGIDNFQCRFSGLFLNIYRDSTSIVLNADNIPVLNGYGDIMTIPGKRFINSVVHNLVNQMMKTGRRGGPDIHTRSFSYCFQPFQNLNLRRIIFFFNTFCNFCHTFFPQILFFDFCIFP